MLNIPNSPSIAVLVDAENITLNLLTHVLIFADSVGIRKTSRAYGDWKKPELSAWYSTVDKLPIDIIQVDNIGKDTADKQLMIEAGEILGEGQIDVFIIVAGDGDFRLLCKRIKEKGRKVIGVGDKGNTSSHLKDVCNSFYYIEDLSRVLLLLKAYRQTTKNGLSHIGQMFKQLRQLDSGFTTDFSGRKPSKWLDMYPHIFNRQGNYVRLASTNT